MNWKKWTIVILLLLVAWVWQDWPEKRLKVVFCDVGQGDGALVIWGSFQAVIDTGAYEDKIVACLSENMPFWDRRIEIIFLSHSDKDHTGALQGMIKRFKIQKIIDQPRSGDIVRYGNLSFDIIKGSNPVEGMTVKNESETNARSVVMRLVYGNLSVLFTGDIDINTELALLDMGVLKKTEVLKVSHHGSKFGSGKDFLEKVRPKLAVISVAAKNNYGHPSSDTLIRLDGVHAKILQTDKMGWISILSDGKTIDVFREK